MEGLLVGRGQAVTGASWGRQCDGDALIPAIKLACRLCNGGPVPGPRPRRRLVACLWGARKDLKH